MHFAHVSCRKSDRENIDIFFECHKWQGKIANNEPHKCAELEFFTIDNFPNNMVQYVHDIILLSEAKVKYSEIGWDEKESFVEEGSEGRRMVYRRYSVAYL